MWDIHAGGGWWILSGWLWMIIFWGALIALVVWAVGRLTERREGPERRGEQPPEEIVKARYARGEISREEYEQILKDLSLR